MSKHTATINDIISGELLRHGKNEFINNGRLSFDNPKYAFIHKIINYDEDVSDICDDVIFKGFKLTDTISDKKFKRAFVNRFLDREINRQTLEAFAAQVVYVALTHEDYLNIVFSDQIEMYLQNHNVTDSKQLTDLISSVLEDMNAMNNTFDNTDEISSNRQAETTLPQSEVNINVDHDELTFADSNAIEKTKQNNSKYSQSDQITDTNTHQNQNTSQNTDTLVKNFDVENIKKIYDLRERIFNHFDRNCFLQIW